VPAAMSSWSDCTRWPESSLCSLIDLEAILGRRASSPILILSAVAVTRNPAEL
jgi:hypothetical protein